MSKKLITACLALVAFAAMALPAVASAKPALCETEGSVCKTLVPPQKIHAHNVGETLLKTDPSSGEPTVLTRCTVATMTGEVTKNNGSEIEGTITKASFEGTGAVVNGKTECTSSFGNISVITEGVENGVPWCVRAGIAGFATDEFQIRGNSCGNPSRPITYILNSTTAGECKYTRSEPIKGTYTTHSTGDAILTVTSKEGTTADTTFTREAGGILCPSTGTLEMSLTLTTDNSPTFTTLYIENNP